MEGAPSVRIDKWLWAVRLYKSRSAAAEACNAGKVHINQLAVRPSRNVHAGEVITAVAGEIKRTVKVIGVIEKRVGAKLVSQSLEDLTPAEEYNKAREKNLQPFMFRPKGSGRPTKKERREMDGMEF